MPNGRTHDKISLITIPIIGISCYYITNNDIKITIIVIISYIFASFMFNGDLDTNSKPYNRWCVFKMIWIPYQIIFNHRSVFTHGIVISTIIRLFYVGLIPLIVVLCYNNDINIVLDYIILNYKTFFYIFVGLELGSIIHTLSDKLF